MKKLLLAAFTLMVVPIYIFGEDKEVNRAKFLERQEREIQERISALKKDIERVRQGPNPGRESAQNFYKKKWEQIDAEYEQLRKFRELFRNAPVRKS